MRHCFSEFCTLASLNGHVRSSVKWVASTSLSQTESVDRTEKSEELNAQSAISPVLVTGNGKVMGLCEWVCTLSFNILLTLAVLISQRSFSR